MAETKQLILVIEGTAALGPYWPTIVSDHLEKSIRSFCGDEQTKKEAGSPKAEVNHVIFNRRSSQWLLQRGAWSDDVEVVMNRLRAIEFSGDDSGDVAIAEGLSAALMMFPYLHAVPNEQHRAVVPKSQSQSQRHCILIAASNPNPLPTPVQTPPFLIEPKTQLADALTVSQAFPKCLISLSVISPTNLPIHKAIYYAAKRNPTPIGPVKSPEFLVRLSQDLKEAYGAQRQHEITKLPSNRSPKKPRIDGTLKD